MGLNGGRIIMKTKNKEEYDKEPVFFCASCLSLKIKSVEGMIDYCDDCGQTNIKTTNIQHWEELYEQKYGHKYVKKNYKSFKNK